MDKKLIAHSYFYSHGREALCSGKQYAPHGSTGGASAADGTLSTSVIGRFMAKPQKRSAGQESKRRE